MWKIKLIAFVFTMNGIVKNHVFKVTFLDSTVIKKFDESNMAPKDLMINNAIT